MLLRRLARTEPAVTASYALMMRSRGFLAMGSIVLAGALLVVSPQIAGASAATYPPFLKPAPGPRLPCSDPSIPAVPAGQIASLEKDVTAYVGPAFNGIGQCAHGQLLLMLRPGSERLAKRVRATFGSSVQIEIGLTNWNGRPGRSATCGTLATPSSIPAGYSATLDLSSTTVRAGANVKGHVVLRATGSASVRVLSYQPIEVVLTKPGERRVVGVYGGAIAGTGYGPLLVPGRSVNVGLVGGTARCDGGLGSALPPGHYDAVAEVSGVAVDGTGGDNGVAPPTYFTTVVPIRVVP
jgi:hypothetical protein